MLQLSSSSSSSYSSSSSSSPSLPGVLISLDDLLQTSLEGHLIGKEENYDVGAVECRWVRECDCWCDTVIMKIVMSRMMMIMMIMLVMMMTIVMIIFGYSLLYHFDFRIIYTHHAYLRLFVIKSTWSVMKKKAFQCTLVCLSRAVREGCRW